MLKYLHTLHAYDSIPQRAKILIFSRASVIHHQPLVLLSASCAPPVCFLSDLLYLRPVNNFIENLTGNMVKIKLNMSVENRENKHKEIENDKRPAEHTVKWPCHFCHFSLSVLFP